MPRSTNGIGTIHYGRSAEAEDGSYVTTVWLIVFFLPIVPLRSERILPLSEFDNGAGGRCFRFSILNRVPLDWAEIRKSYLVGWSILGWCVSLIYSYGYLARFFGSDHGPWIIVGWLIAPFAVLFAWQKWFRVPSKLKPVEVMPGSEFSVYRKSEPTDKNGPKSDSQTRH